MNYYILIPAVSLVLIIGVFLFLTKRKKQKQKGSPDDIYPLW
jgi:preprotein translocase subunit YajC